MFNTKLGMRSFVFLVGMTDDINAYSIIYQNANYRKQKRPVFCGFFYDFFKRRVFFHGTVRFGPFFTINAGKFCTKSGVGWRKPTAQTAPITPAPQEQNSTAEQENEKKQDAILAFLDAHEKRAGRVKK